MSHILVRKGSVFEYKPIVANFGYDWWRGGGELGGRQLKMHKQDLYYLTEALHAD